MCQPLFERSLIIGSESERVCPEKNLSVLIGSLIADSQALFNGKGSEGSL